MKIIIIICILFISGIFLQARIITVDKIAFQGDYTNLQDAYDAANSGDTLYVYPYAEPYYDITINKRIIIIGSGGWKIDENTTLTTKISYVDDVNAFMIFSTGSEGSVIKGFDGFFWAKIYVDNISIENNCIRQIDISDSCRNITIRGNYFEGYFSYFITIASGSDVLITNNLFEQVNPNACECIYDNNQISNITINHNVFSSTGNTMNIRNSNCSIENNINVLGWIHYGTGCTFFNNICNSTQLPEGNENIRNMDMSTVFIDYDNGNYHLKPNSPAKGSGKNGVDMGIYGGSTPFVDGGFPGIPSIIELDADHLGSKQSGIKVKIKAKSNKE
ncbi:hypothetical protein ACFLSQ_05960 [Bacteroidota bacterium]